MYIIGKRLRNNQDHRITMAPAPALQGNLETAQMEATRLAGLAPQAHEFLIFKLVAGVEPQVAPTKYNEY